MTIDWTAWDIQDEFPLFIVACLWADKEPSDELRDNLAIQELMEAIKFGVTPYVPRVDVDLILWVVGGRQIVVQEQNRYPEYITREAVKQLAEAKGVRPKFLFPEERKDRPTQVDSKPIQNDKPRFSDYQIALQAVLRKLDIYLSKKRVFAEFNAIVEISGYRGFSRKKVNKLLDPQFDMSNRKVDPREINSCRVALLAGLDLKLLRVNTVLT